MTWIIDRFDGVVKEDYWNNHHKTCIGTPIDINRRSPLHVQWKCIYEFDKGSGCNREAIIKCSDICSITFTDSTGYELIYAQAWCKDHDPRKFQL